MKTIVYPRFSKILLRIEHILLVCTITAQAGTLAFNHDLAGRLTTATFAGSKSIAYTYDAAGSLVQRQISIGAGSNFDTDNDGLADVWEQLYFGNLSRNGAGDFDNDGFLDLSEFLAGTIPTNSASALRVFGNPASGGGGTTVEWSAVSGRTYRLQFKYPLEAANWSNVPGDVTAAGPVASKVDPTAAGQLRRFYRVMLVP